MKAILTLVGLALAISAAQGSTQVVRTDAGAVRGKPFKTGFEFRGIPFAAPPVGPLRWRAPSPAPSWSGVRSATELTPSCIQPDQGWNKADFSVASEDCLTLDVRTPSLGGKRPVLVWIHGGSNRAGGPGDMIQSPLGDDAVLVGVRYRLGILGFLSHPKLTAEQGASGNYGLMDQVAALQWVQRNIARFGGDPHNVTIAGESAGSQDVSLLLLSPMATGLFQKAIMQSGTPGFGLPFRSRLESERVGQQADALLEAGGDLAKLRSASIPALLQVDSQLHDSALDADDYLWLRTTIDGRFLPDSPESLVGRAPVRPVIIGSNRFELDLPGGRPHRDSFLARAFGAREQQARAFYQADELNLPADARMGTTDQQLATDATFRCPASQFARLLAERGMPVWQYEFDAAKGGGMTRHSAEISYAFWDDTFGKGLSLRPYWSRFIATGDPNAASLAHWPRTSADRPSHVRFDDNGVHALGALRPEICSLSEHL